jgi:hypothetical protein
MMRLLVSFHELNGDPDVNLFKKQTKNKQNEKNQNPKTEKKLKKKTKICTKRWIWYHQVKYLLRAWPFTGKVSGCPSKLCRRKEMGPSFSEITNYPDHKFWNLVCSPFPLWVLSHFENQFSTSKFLSEEEFESNHLFTIYLC